MSIIRSVPVFLPLALLTVLAGAVVVGPLVWPIDPYTMDFAAILAPPGPGHWMGTDSVGRDVLARFLAGGRLSLSVGVIVMLGGLVPGAIVGVIAARAGGIVDMVLMRAMDSIAAFPPILLAMAVAIGLGGGLWTAVIGVIISTLPFFARLMRSEVLRIMSHRFVDAAESMGATPAFILLWHVSPHAASTMLVQCAAVFGYAIITLAGLGFVGLGAEVPTAEWGVMITEGMKYALTGQWWLTVFPGLGILVAVSAANLLADGLSATMGGRHA
ncbi:MAG: ABC transporter permease [Bauldia litoralis]